MFNFYTYLYISFLTIRRRRKPVEHAKPRTQFVNGQYEPSAVIMSPKPEVQNNQPNTGRGEIYHEITDVSKGENQTNAGDQNGEDLVDIYAVSPTLKNPIVVTLGQESTNAYETIPRNEDDNGEMQRSNESNNPDGYVSVDYTSGDSKKSGPAYEQAIVSNKDEEISYGNINTQESKTMTPGKPKHPYELVFPNDSDSDDDTTDTNSTQLPQPASSDGGVTKALHLQSQSNGTTDWSENNIYTSEENDEGWKNNSIYGREDVQ